MARTHRIVPLDRPRDVKYFSLSREIEVDRRVRCYYAGSACGISSAGFARAKLASGGLNGVFNRVLESSTGVDGDLRGDLLS